MGAYGIPGSDFSRAVEIDPKTLRKHYLDELDLGESKANDKVAGFLFLHFSEIVDNMPAVISVSYWPSRVSGAPGAVLNEHGNCPSSPRAGFTSLPGLWGRRSSFSRSSRHCWRLASLAAESAHPVQCCFIGLAGVATC